MQPRRARSSSRLATLALASMLIATPAVAQQADQVDTKGEKEVTALGKNIDRAGASADAGKVTGKIVDQWKGTQFRLDVNSAPRELTAQDIQNLRQQRLGYGEISNLLALTAKQPDATTAKSLNEVLAMRQAGDGWGKIAKALGYRSLGAVKQSLKATEAHVERVKAERVSKLDKADRMNKYEKGEKFDKPERVRIDKPERAEKPGR